MESEVLTTVDPQVDYYKIDRMSNSAMSHFRRSPRHYLYYKNVPQEPTPAMIFGNAFHTYILENDKFEERYISTPDDAPNYPSTKQWGAKKPSDETVKACNWWLDFEAKTKGKILLSVAEIETIKRMHDALYKCEPAMELLNAFTETEKELMWDDDVTGVKMKGKLDGYNPVLTVDLKTCVNAQPEVVTRDAYSRDHHRQAAIYTDGRKAMGLNGGEFWFIYLEKEPPYGISVMKCSKEFIEAGRYAYTQILEDFQYWQQMGCPDEDYSWRQPFGYHTLNLPGWVK